MNREDQIQEEINALQKERELLRSRKTLMCGCGKRSQLSKWILIQDHHYIRPYSCSGGDYWVMSDEFHLVCPKCEGVGRTYLPSWVERDRKDGKNIKDNFMYSDKEAGSIALYDFVNKHSKYFGETLDSYDDGYDVDVLREKKKNKTQSY